MTCRARGAPLLRKVSIVLRRNAGSDVWLRMLIEDILLTFSNCSELQQLEIHAHHTFNNRIEAVANLCRRLRFQKKGVMHVRVLGVEYNC